MLGVPGWHTSTISDETGRDGGSGGCHGVELFAVLTQLALQQQHFVLQMPLLSPGGQQSQKVSQSTTPHSLQLSQYHAVHIPGYP